MEGFYVANTNDVMYLVFMTLASMQVRCVCVRMKGCGSLVLPT